MRIIEWLCHRDDGFGHLSNAERESIVDFAMLWMYFEARLVNAEASVKSLKRLATHLADAVDINTEVVSTCYEYFRNRYWDDGKPSAYVPGLEMTKALAEDVIPMLANPPPVREKLITCLLIVFRYRNNLFHGNKWAYRLEGQQQNFEHATQLLLAVIAFEDSRRGAAKA